MQKAAETQENDHCYDWPGHFSTLFLVEVSTLRNCESTFNCHSNWQPIFYRNESAKNELGEDAADAKSTSMLYNCELGENEEDQFVGKDEDDKDRVNGGLKQVESTTNFSQARRRKGHYCCTSTKDGENEQENC